MIKNVCINGSGLEGLDEFNGVQGNVSSQTNVCIYYE